MGQSTKPKLGGNEVVVISNVQMLDELCNETRFCKVIAEGLARIKRPGPSDVFTAPPRRCALETGSHRYTDAGFFLDLCPISAMFDGMSATHLNFSIGDG